MSTCDRRGNCSQENDGRTNGDCTRSDRKRNGPAEKPQSHEWDPRVSHNPGTHTTGFDAHDIRGQQQHHHHLYSHPGRPNQPVAFLGQPVTSHGRSEHNWDTIVAPCALSSGLIETQSPSTSGGFRVVPFLAPPFHQIQFHPPPWQGAWHGISGFYQPQGANGYNLPLSRPSMGHHTQGFRPVSEQKGECAGSISNSISISYDNNNEDGLPNRRTKPGKVPGTAPLSTSSPGRLPAAECDGVHDSDGKDCTGLEEGNDGGARFRIEDVSGKFAVGQVNTLVEEGHGVPLNESGGARKGIVTAVALHVGGDTATSSSQAAATAAMATATAYSTLGLVRGGGGGKELSGHKKTKAETAAKARERAARRRYRVESIKEKDASERTGEEESLLDQCEAARQRKNHRSRERAAQVKERVQWILSQQSTERSAADIQLLGVHVARKRRKQETDSLRRARMKRRPRGVQASEVHGNS